MEVAMRSDKGIDAGGNDEAARAMLRPNAAVRAGNEILPGIDSATGEVSGSGSGTGGGNAGEDHDDDHTAGSNTVR